MGLGKTVEVIGCIMSNKWEPAKDFPVKNPPAKETLPREDVVHDLSLTVQTTAEEEALPPATSGSGKPMALPGHRGGGRGAL